MMMRSTRKWSRRVMIEGKLERALRLAVVVEGLTIYLKMIMVMIGR